MGIALSSQIAAASVRTRKLALSYPFGTYIEGGIANLAMAQARASQCIPFHFVPARAWADGQRALDMS